MIWKLINLELLYFKLFCISKIVDFTPIFGSIISNCMLKLCWKMFYLLYVFSNDYSNCNLWKMPWDIDCKDKVPHHSEFSNDSSNCQSKWNPLDIECSDIVFHLCVSSSAIFWWRFMTLIARTWFFTFVCSERILQPAILCKSC